MPKKQRCPSCSSGWCKNHVFELIPIKTNLYFRKIEKARFCPRLNKTTKVYQQIIPQVNKDNKYYTPSFILQEQQSFYCQNDQRMVKSHEEKIGDMLSGHTGDIVRNFDPPCEW